MSGHVFRERVEGWAEVVKLTASDGAQENRFGDGLAPTGHSMLIGAPDVPADHTGAVYAFELCPCPADVDGSGAVDFGDILAVLTVWGQVGGPEDVDESGTVDFGDVLLVLSTWGPRA